MRLGWRFWSLAPSDDLVGVRLEGPYTVTGVGARGWTAADAMAGELVARCARCAHPPGDGCTCGIAFYARLGELVAHRPSPVVVVSPVVARGRVLPDPDMPGDTWRAERIEILGLYVPPVAAPYRAQLSRDYRVPVTVTGAGADVLPGLLERATADGWPAVTRDEVVVAAG